ncbi:MAG: hypothetical protein V3T31_13425 [candidate division Zixibacteria bacterium]
MFSSRTTTMVLVLILLTLGGTLTARDQAAEVGMDVGINTGSGAHIPLACRGGFFPSKAFALEFKAGLSSLEGYGTNVYGVGIGIAAHGHTIETPGQTRAFFGPALNIAFLKHNSAFGIGGDAGLKVPLSDRFSARFQLNVSRWFETEGRVFTQLTLSAGLSFFTK